MTNLSSASEKPEAIFPSGFGLGPRELDTVFPFHFVIDSETRVIRAGPAIQRLLPDLAGGKKFDSSFRIKHPANLVEYKEICEHSDQLFLLEARSLDKLLLKGQMLYLPHADAIVFIGAPWLTDSSDIGALGLSLNDFAIHDSVPDYLLLLRTLTTSLGDAQVLAEQLNVMNRQLEDRIEERTQEVVSANATLMETNHRLLQEIAERKRAEQILSESESRFREIFNTVNDAIFIHDAETGRIVDVNRSMCEMYGFTREAALACSPDDLSLGTPPFSSVEAIEKIHLAHTDGPQTFDWLARARDGHLFWVEVNLRFALIGNQQRILAVARDITERKEFEEELKRSNVDLEQFSYAVSHDMRQPLRMISSYLQLLELGLADQLDNEKRGYFDSAIEGAKRIDQMLVDLLEYSRVGRKGEPPTWIDSRTLLDEALQFLQPAIAEAQAKLSIAGEWPRILVSHDEILMLLQNLIGNAVKYRITGRIPEITVTCEVVKNEWRLCVADNGVGIIPGQIKRLFQMFQRLHTREAYEGTGIGLALCRKIAEHHKGRIWAESEGEGQGSKFCIALPMPQEKTISARGITT